MSVNHESARREPDERRDADPGFGPPPTGTVPHSSRRCRRAALYLLVISTIGTVALGAARAVFAQVPGPAAPEVLPAAGGPEPPPFVPVKVGRYYINIPAICYAYWSAPRVGEARSFVVEFGQGTRVILSEDEGGDLVQVFPSLIGEGQLPARADGLAAPPAPSP